MTVEPDLEALNAITHDAGDEELIRSYLDAAEANKPALWVVRYDDGETYRWTAIDTRNGRIVAASTQAYDDPRDRDHNIEMVLGGGYRLDIS